jgi:ATP-binding cassette subfamily B (MDR/TAP) protein 1
MSNGRIVEQGTHEQLIEKQGVYCELVTAQQIDKDKPHTSDANEQAKKEEENDDEEDTGLEELMRKLSKRINTSNITSQVRGIFSETRRSSFDRNSMPQHRVSVTPGSMRIGDTPQEENSYKEQEPEYGWWHLTRFLFSFNRLEKPHMIGGFLACVICGLAPPTQAGKFRSTCNPTVYALT